MGGARAEAENASVRALGSRELNRSSTRKAAGEQKTVAARKRITRGRNENGRKQLNRKMRMEVMRA